MEQFMTEDLYPYIDAVSYHIYTHWWYAENNEFNLQHNNYNEIIADQGGWKPLTITETGWQMSVGSHIQGAEEKKQASELVKRAVILDDLGYSDLMFYDFKNDGNDISDPEHNFGVIKNNQSAKMSYYSIKNYLKNVGKAQYLGKALFDNRIEAYAYKSNDGNFLITWAKPDNTQTNIANNNNSNPEYTFSYDVTIKDMFGEKTKSKNTLKSDYDPKYVYGFTDRQILDMLATYGTDELISLPEEQKECEASIKEEYLKLLNVGTKDALDEYIDFCYSKGDKLIEEYKAGTLNIKASEFSNMLYNIHNAAYKGSRTAVCITGLSSEVSIEDISAEYEKTDALIEFADMIKLRYLSEPFNKGKELLKKTKKYSEEGRGTPKSGENYNLQSDGSLKIKGAEDAEFTAVEIYSGTELVWRDTIIKADGNEAELTLPEFGEYILKTSETKDQIITYSGDNYYSCEDAMTYCNAENSKRLLTWTKTLAEDFFESKSSGLPSYITKKTEAGRNYLSINKPEKEGTILAAAYKDGTLKAAAIAGEDGICVLDVTGLDNYTLKIFDWKKSMVPSGAAEVYDGIKA